MATLLERIRAYRWPLVMGFIVLASGSSVVWLWRQGLMPGAAAVDRSPTATELTALQQLQEENNALTAELQRVQGVSPTVLGATTAPLSALINLNTATAAELDTLPGIGPSKAAAILQYRTDHGPFRTTRELMNVKGIGDSTYDALKDLVTVE